MKIINYDVILVGAGISNIITALELSTKTNLSIAIMEQGKDIEKRKCPKSSKNTCLNCNPCQITAGFSGAGCFSDCKLTYSPEVGGNLTKYIDEETFYEELDYIDTILNTFGARGEYKSSEEFTDKLELECQRYNLKLIKSKVRHLGTDGSYDVMYNIYKYLVNEPTVNMFFDTKVDHIDFQSKSVFTKDTTYCGEYIVIAPGRSGSEFLRNVCIANDVPVTCNSVDIGVRVEVPRIITDSITNELYEFKIIDHNGSIPVRTFCVNPGGYVVQENYPGIKAVNGHSYSDNKSFATNFALLASCTFTEPFNDPIEYATNICKLTNVLADDHVMVQRLCDLASNRRSTYERMSRLSITPTLKDACPGDLSYAFPSKILDRIIKTLYNLDNIMPGIAGNNTILYGPEVKFVSSVPSMNKDFSCVGYNDVYFSGDGAGITRGIMQAAINGSLIADNIRKLV